MKNFLSRRKGLIIGIAVILVVLAALVVTGAVRLGGSSQVEVETNSQSSLPEVPENIPVDESVAGEKLGLPEVPASEQYRPTEQEVMDVITSLIAFDSNSESYESWHERADRLIAYTEQDFPQEAVLSYTPNPQEWDEGWARTFNAMGADELAPYRGQGGGRIYTWLIDGKQDLTAPDGSPWVGGFTEITAAFQCAGDSIASCQVLTYTGTWPLRFDEERALGEP